MCTILLRIILMCAVWAFCLTQVCTAVRPCWTHLPTTSRPNWHTVSNFGKFNVMIYNQIFVSLFIVVVMTGNGILIHSTEPGEREWVILWQQIEASYGSRKVWYLLDLPYSYFLNSYGLVYLVNMCPPLSLPRSLPQRNAVQMSSKVMAIQ